jgi:hypothetical protein
LFRRLFPPALDHVRDLFVLLRHLRETVVPQAVCPLPVPLPCRLGIILARFLGIVIGHLYALVEMSAGQVRAVLGGSSDL